MFGDVALQLIKLMKHSGTMPSALAAEDVPGALQALQEALLAKQDTSQDDITEDALNTVSLGLRAVPLVNLLKHAQQSRLPVMWCEL
jgi:hypothetical protein